MKHKKILLMRHAQALNTEQNPDRPLSSIGEQEVKKMAAWMHAMQIPVKSILHSSVLRSQQTAQAVGEKLGIQPTLMSALNPDESVVTLAGIIGNLESHTLLVGHLPNLALLSNLLLTYDEQCNTLEFVPCAIAAFTLTENSCTVDWALNPSLIPDKPILL